MYTVKGYVGSEEKLKQYFAEHVFGEKTRVQFVDDEILPDHITCFEYLDSIRQTKNYNESDDTLEGLLEFAEIDKNANIGSLSVGERSRLLLTGVIFLRAEDYVLCGLYEGVTMKDAEILDQILTELSLIGNLHVGYIGEPPTDICDEIIYL
ncbi:MAG: hypothetical protein NC429_16785 [Lachnospiraceae bacterium]|nr:hypothetical protein [Lachnospiraceae bacterium]